MLTIYTFAVNSIIGSLVDGAMLKSGKTTVAGYALPSGEPGCKIAQVELSLDGGKSWRATKLEGGEKAAKPFTWQLWSADVELPAGKHELVVRATDSCGHRQPETAEWNLKGYMFNAWQRVQVEVNA
jgi:sulfite oxidase